MVHIEERIEIKRDKGQFEAKIVMDEVDTGSGIEGIIQISESFPEEDDGSKKTFIFQLKHFEHFLKLVGRANAKIGAMKEALKTVKEK